MSASTYSSVVSTIVRQLVLGGTALVWLIKVGTPEADSYGLKDDACEGLVLGLLLVRIITAQKLSLTSVRSWPGLVAAVVLGGFGGAVLGWQTWTNLISQISKPASMRKGGCSCKDPGHKTNTQYFLNCRFIMLA
ncbi:hypothetical protein [Rhodoferax sp. BLA1]|uniref:hypothetical protein n=1 Tax=Rhodoferax sp. BLA1 TaxID=2576062 RepID=UPI0015D3CEB0|nr:hypothetical protein [Rhodoferax sp. BLA1]